MAPGGGFADTAFMQDFGPREELELGPTYRALTMTVGVLIVPAVLTVLIIAALTNGL